MGVRRDESGRSRLRACRSTRPETIRICGGSSAPMLLSYEVVDAVAGQRDVRRVRVHFTVLVEGPLDVSTIKTARSVSTIVT